ncbi:MAG: hypothetical protein AAGE01_24300 [Pseudomonadota bacterium]
MITVENQLVACHECGALYRREAIPEGARADCERCGALLYRNVPGSVDRSLALFSAAFMRDQSVI